MARVATALSAEGRVNEIMNDDTIIILGFFILVGYIMKKGMDIFR